MFVRCYKYNATDAILLKSLDQIKFDVSSKENVQMKNDLHRKIYPLFRKYTVNIQIQLFKHWLNILAEVPYVSLQDKIVSASTHNKATNRNCAIELYIATAKTANLDSDEHTHASILAQTVNCSNRYAMDILKAIKSGNK